jgi:ribonuclease E
MVLESNRDLVLRRLIECLARDRTKHQVAEVTSLGLVQMTRKRVGTGLLAAFSVPCEHCNGRGLLVSTELTELPQPHGRNGQQGGPAKTGSSRSRSARTKAIAQVAKSIETPGENGDGEEPVETDFEPIAEPVASVAASSRTRSARAGSGVTASTGSESGETSSAAATRAETGPAETGPAETGEAAGSGSRRRPRRSAHREAGPPASVSQPAVVSEHAVAGEPAVVGEPAGAADPAAVADPGSVADAPASVPPAPAPVTADALAQGPDGEAAGPDDGARSPMADSTSATAHAAAGDGETPSAASPAGESDPAAGS